MAINSVHTQKKSLWGMKMVEWSLLAGVVLMLLWVLARQVQVLQGQAELAAVKTTLEALRTALVVDYLKKNVASNGSTTVRLQGNPFRILNQYPANYRGDMMLAEAMLVPAGSWVFDPVCVCVGYAPTNDRWFESPSGGRVAWYQLNGSSGPTQLTAQEAYIWQKKAMN